MKIILINPFLPSFYEDSPNATNHFPLCLLPLQCVATPKPQSLNDSIKIDKTKQKSCKFYNLGQPKHSIQPINSEYQNYASALCGFLPIFRSIQNVKTMPQHSVDFYQLSCLQFRECKLYRHPVCLIVIRNHSFPSCLPWFRQVWPPTCLLKPDHHGGGDPDRWVRKLKRRIKNRMTSGRKLQSSWKASLLKSDPKMPLVANINSQEIAALLKIWYPTMLTRANPMSVKSGWLVAKPAVGRSSHNMLTSPELCKFYKHCFRNATY